MIFRILLDPFSVAVALLLRRVKISPDLSGVISHLNNINKRLFRKDKKFFARKNTNFIDKVLKTYKNILLLIIYFGLNIMLELIYIL